MEFLDEKEDNKVLTTKKSKIASIICISFNQDRVSFSMRKENKFYIELVGMWNNTWISSI